MAQIVINPISNNYSINVGNASYCTVALPITACWGPAFKDTESVEDELEETVWSRFPSTQAGFESFVATYRGPATIYRRAKDYSYQEALTLLANGYDVLVCRLCPGTTSSGQFTEKAIYELLAAAPSDWADNYASYFEKNGDNYVAVAGVEETVAPEFAENTYYKFESDEYVLLATEPSDWATGYANYFTKTGEETYAAVQGVTQTVAPTFVTDKYYKKTDDGSGILAIQAKYPGTFGNNLEITLRKVTSSVSKPYWNAIIYAVDPNTKNRSSLENLVFAFDEENVTDNILHISEIESNFIVFSNYDGLTDASELVGTATSDIPAIKLEGGSDVAAQNDEDTVASILTEAQGYAKTRFKLSVKNPGEVDNLSYIKAIIDESATPDPHYATTDKNIAYAIRYREWVFTQAVAANANKLTGVYDLLKDKLTYNPNRVISPWDDQNFYELGATEPISRFGTISPIHIKLMDVAYYSRCATALLDIPKSLARQGVWINGDDATEGYVQKLCRYEPAVYYTSTGLYTSSSALFAPWGQYTYTGTSRQAPASPAFLALMITRAMILNQANQYEWALPTVRSNNFKLSKLDYTIPEDLLNLWQSREGCRLNVITNLPEIGACVWGNSTLFEVPPATYQALANLSTRYIFNAIQDVVYKVGIGITYQYSNANAYDRFYAGVTPILDAMSNLGALVKGADVPGRTDLDDPGYYVTMAADINGLDSVNANSVIGKIVIRTAGVIEDITIDLIALPQSAALTTA